MQTHRLSTHYCNGDLQLHIFVHCAWQLNDGLQTVRKETIFCGPTIENHKISTYKKGSLSLMAKSDRIHQLHAVRGWSSAHSYRESFSGFCMGALPALSWLRDCRQMIRLTEQTCRAPFNELSLRRAQIRREVGTHSAVSEATHTSRTNSQQQKEKSQFGYKLTKIFDKSFLSKVGLKKKNCHGHNQGCM